MVLQWMWGRGGTRRVKKKDKGEVWGDMRGTVYCVYVK